MVAASSEVECLKTLRYCSAWSDCRVCRIVSMSRWNLEGWCRHRLVALLLLCTGLHVVDSNHFVVDQHCTVVQFQLAKITSSNDDHPCSSRDFAVLHDVVLGGFQYPTCLYSRQCVRLLCKCCASNFLWLDATTRLGQLNMIIKKG